jgi:antirestriction protein
MDNATETIYKAWKHNTEDEDRSEERFEEVYIGQFYSLEALAEDVLYDSGSVDDFWEGKDKHPLAYYFRFDYEMYGRDLELNGDVYSIEQAGETHYFWAHR